MPQMSTSAPARKVTVGAFTGAVSVLIVWILNTYALPADKQITPEIASSITTALSFIVSYLVPPAASDQVV